MAITLYGSGQTPIQIQTTNKSDTWSSTSTSFVDVTGMSVAITPKSATNKVLVTITMCVSCTDSNRGTFQLVRNGTVIANTLGTSGGFYSCAFDGYISTGFITCAFTYLDSPATTSAVTYRIQAMTNAGTVYVNRNRGSGTGTGYIGYSTITTTEVAYA